MKRSEGIELTVDVDEALIDLGTMDGEPNIIWRERLKAVPNRTFLHENDFTPKFVDNPMYCLPMGQLTNEEITNEGLAGGKYFKYYISGKQFEDIREDWTPKNADRIIHRKISYEVEKTKTIQVGEVNVLYVVYAKESPIAIQSEGYREEQDPYFEYDASQEVDATNDVTDNSNLFIDYPVEIEIKGEFPILVWESDSRFKYKTNEMEEPVIFSIPPGAYTIQEFKDIFITDGIKVIERDDKYFIQSISVGVKAFLDILVVNENIYDLLGISVGLYKGREELKL